MVYDLGSMLSRHYNGDITIFFLQSPIIEETHIQIVYIIRKESEMNEKTQATDHIY